MWHLTFASALPDRTVTAAEIAAWTKGEETFIRDKIGIASRRLLEPDETPLSLAVKAAKKGMEKAGVAASDISWVIYVTQNPDFRLPQSSALLCDELGLDSNVAAFDLNLGCSGWVYALTMADAFANAQNLGSGIILTCDPYSRAIEKTDKNTVSVFGDAAAATVFRRGGSFTIGRGTFGTDGAGGMGLSMRSGGAREPITSIDAQIGQASDGDHAIRMDGRAILDFMQKRVPDAVSDCLAANTIAVGDIDRFVFHQASKFMLELLIRRMKLDAEKVPIVLENTGNTVSSTIPMALETLQDSDQLKGNILVCGFGVGLSWAANLIKIQEGQT